MLYGIRAPWWPFDPPRCETCGAWHHACDCLARAAVERVKIKRALRKQLMEQGISLEDIKGL